MKKSVKTVDLKKKHRFWWKPQILMKTVDFDENCGFWWKLRILIENHRFQWKLQISMKTADFNENHRFQKTVDFDENHGFWWKPQTVILQVKICGKLWKRWISMKMTYVTDFGILRFRPLMMMNYCLIIDFNTIYKLASLKTIYINFKAILVCHGELSKNWLLSRRFINWLLSRSSEFVIINFLIIDLFQDHLSLSWWIV